MSPDITFDALAQLFTVNKNLIQLAVIFSLLALILAGAALWYARLSYGTGLVIMEELKKAETWRVAKALREATDLGKPSS